MPHKTTFDDTAGIIMTHIDGIADAAEMRSVLKESAELSAANKCNRWLLDLTGAKDAMTTLDFFELPKFMDGLGKTVGIPVHRIKIAVAAAVRTNEHLFAEMVSANRGQNIRVFNNAPAAQAWLLSKEEKKVPVQRSR